MALPLLSSSLDCCVNVVVLQILLVGRDSAFSVESRSAFPLRPFRGSWSTHSFRFKANPYHSLSVCCTYSSSSSSSRSGRLALRCYRYVVHGRRQGEGRPVRPWRAGDQLPVPLALLANYGTVNGRRTFAESFGGFGRGGIHPVVDSPLGRQYILETKKSCA